MALIEDNLIGAIGSTGDTLLKCMMIVTAIEFCGSIVTGETDPTTTETNFSAFWNSEYMPKEYHRVGDLLYKILRNGVSHSFVAKGGVIPSAEAASSGKHMKFFEQGVFIYVPQLEKDVVSGIRKLLEDMGKGKDHLKEHYDSVLSELQRSGKAEYDKFVKENKIEVSPEQIRGDIHPDGPRVVIADPLVTATGSTVSLIASASTIVLSVKPPDQDLPASPHR
jgi:hypothetical protein